MHMEYICCILLFTKNIFADKDNDNIESSVKTVLLKIEKLLTSFNICT